MSNNPSKEDIEKMVKLAAMMGIGDGTVETVLTEGICFMVEMASKEFAKGNTKEAFELQQKALKGIASYLIRDNLARKENHSA